MATTSIKISELTAIPSIDDTDYFPINKVTSPTTYYSSISSLKTELSSGSFTGSFLGTGSSPQFIGTGSWAISSSNARTSSYAITSSNSLTSSYAITSSRALTASYLLGSPGTTSGTGTVDYVPIWATTTSLGDSDVYRISATGGYSYIYESSDIILRNGRLTLSGSSTRPAALRVQQYNYSNPALSDGYISLHGLGKATVYLENYNRATAYPNNDTVAIQLTNSGSLTMYMTSGSTQLSPLSGGYDADEYYFLKNIRNDMYFFPHPGASTPARDAKIGIGIDAPTAGYTVTSSLKARLHIATWVSGSSDYGSAVISDSLPGIVITQRALATGNVDVFYVSASGHTTAVAFSGSDYSRISFYGSSSYAATSSQAITASYLLLNNYYVASITTQNISSSGYITGSAIYTPGSIYSGGSITGSSLLLTGNITASSISSSGYISSSNLFVSGNVVINGNVSASSFTGSLLGTSSWSISSSQALTASYILGSNVTGSVVSSSYSVSSSWSPVKVLKYESGFTTVPEYNAADTSITFNPTSTFSGRPDQFHGYLHATATDNSYVSGSMIPLEFLTTDPVGANDDFNPTILFYDANTGFIKFIRSATYRIAAFDNTLVPGTTTLLDISKWKLRVIAIKYDY